MLGKRASVGSEASAGASWHRRGITAAVATGALAFAGLGAAACSSSPAASTTTQAATATTAAPAPQNVAMQLNTSGTGHSDWPQFVPGDFTVNKGAQVTLTITNHDDGTAPLTSALSQYDNVQGGTETVDGTAVTSEPNANVAHTFTVPELGVNVVIPAAPTGGTNTIVFTFTPSKAGTFTWNCYAPCGSGSDGMGGAMVTDGWMTGKVTVA